ncbi:unnamed protein product [Brassica oleracea var. botrytis]
MILNTVYPVAFLSLWNSCFTTTFINFSNLSFKG